MEVVDSDILVKGITGPWTLDLSETDDEMAVLSKQVDNGDTSGRLLLRVTVERDRAEALLVIKVVDEFETIPED